MNLLYDLLRSGVGGLRVAPLMRRERPGPRRIAFQSYAVHLAQMFRPIVARLRSRPDIELSFLLFSHPQFPAPAAAELKEFVRDELGIAPERIRRYDEALWERFDMVIYNDVYARFPLAPTRNCLLTHGPMLEERWRTSPAPRRGAGDPRAGDPAGPRPDGVAVVGPIPWGRIV